MGGPTTALRGPIGPSRVAVRLVVWGRDAADQDRAIREAGLGWAHRTWEVTLIERLTGAHCPLPGYDPRSIVGEAGRGWAYLAYPGWAAA